MTSPPCSSSSATASSAQAPSAAVRPSAQTTSPSPATPLASGAGPTLSGKGSKTRPKVYLVDKLEPSLGFAKLPKSKAVLSVFLFHLQGSDTTSAGNSTLSILKEVWKHHFGPRVVLGYDIGMEEATKKIISDDKYILEKIINLWKNWRDMERTSKRKDRATKPSFLKQQDNFLTNVLDLPFNILCRDYEDILKTESGIKDWREDLQHLHNQLQKEQVGTCDGYDAKQQKRDNRLVFEKLREDAKKSASSDMDQIEEADSDDDIEEEELKGKERDDGDFVYKRKKKSSKKLDVMGPISATADRLGLSVRARTLMAASVANTLGVDLDKTNISKSNAWKVSQKKRVELGNSIKENFQCPKLAVLQWDGKNLSVKGNKESNRIAVYISGVDESGFRKLLGAPETPDGTGFAEAEVVKEVMEEWGVKEEVCGLVFDTTSTNTGADMGACKFLEDWLGKPMLWLACRHHVHELHLKRVCQGIFGQTKDPGVSLFRRLKSTFNSLEVDYENLSKFDFSSVPSWMEEEGKSFLAWAEKELAKKTWPRADYKELLMLTIICLGGVIPGFQFRLPGPDHHARWMSKVIYILKIMLLLHQFQMSAVEKSQVTEISKFILIFYVKHWFQSPLPTAAARNDLIFMANMLKYRLEVSPMITFCVMQSCYRHLWYLVPQTVVFALADPELSDSQKQGMAKKLHSLERSRINTGKPVFPGIVFTGEEISLPDMADFVSSDSWLVFDVLGLTGSQDWLTIPPNLWVNFMEFRMLKEFAINVSVCNDVAERGVALISNFIDMAESEEQRQALIQVVEFHRALVTNCNKSSMKKC